MNHPDTHVMTPLALTPFLAALLAAGGFGASQDSGQDSGRDSGRAAQRQVVTGNNAFACDLYQELRGGDQNLCLAPFSIRTAVAMAAAGAVGETAREMAATLHMPATGPAAQEALAALLRDLSSDPKPGAARLGMANALWHQSGWDLRADFRELVCGAYGAGLSAVDFTAASDAVRLGINAWVAERTGKLITELLQPGDLRPSTQMVLVNAVHFQGAWLNAFDADLTRLRRFTVPADLERGRERMVVDVPMMSAQREVSHWSDDELAVIELPCAGQRFSMAILLPRSADGLADLEARLDADFLDRCLDRLRPQKMTVLLPRFEARSRMRLKETLSTLGMPLAFTGQADFSGIASAAGIRMDDVIPEARMRVDERGVEAAGATAVMMRKGGDSFVAKHPFLYMLRDRRTGTILLLGRVVNPL